MEETGEAPVVEVVMGSVSDGSLASGAAVKPKKRIYARKRPIKHVTVEGVTCRGILEDMLKVYGEADGKYDENAGQRRWRKMLREAPEKFLRTMRGEQAAQKAEDEENRRRAEEGVRLVADYAAARLRIEEVEGELTAALGRVSELEGELSRMLPEVAGESLSGERLEELETRLLREAKA